LTSVTAYLISRASAWRSERAETSSKRSLSDWKAAKATPMVTSGPRTVIAIAA
jgi:hypothetical protein